MEAGGHVPFRRHRADRVGLCGNRAEARDDTGNPRLIQHQAIHHRRAQPLVTPVGEVFGIGGDDIGPRGPDRVGGKLQRACLCLWVGVGKL
ncbi:hypothetical protein GALL_500990 [mine drainage metagenome]|uniref:Uncharacterized protein n=1 Tax=mine drainage metagenome TaxID=410659 RepID=A0A1J5PC42_9ZZZZ